LVGVRMGAGDELNRREGGRLTVSVLVKGTTVGTFDV